MNFEVTPAQLKALSTRYLNAEAYLTEVIKTIVTQHLNVNLAHVRNRYPEEVKNLSDEEVIDLGFTKGILLSKADRDKAAKLIVKEIKEVTALQGKLALFNRGLLDQIEASIAAIPDEKIRGAYTLRWEKATVFERNAPTTLEILKLVNITEPADIDGLFLEASKL